MPHACKQIIASLGKMFVSLVLTDDNNTRGRHSQVSRGPLSSLTTLICTECVVLNMNELLRKIEM